MWIERNRSPPRGARLESCLEFFEAGGQDRAAMEFLEGSLAADVIDPLAHGGGHLTKPGVKDVENCLAGVLNDAFFKTFDEAFLATFLAAFLATFLEGEFFEEGDVGHGFVG